MSGSHPLLATLHDVLVSLQGAPGPFRDGDARVVKLCETIEAVLQLGLKPQTGLFSEPKGGAAAVFFCIPFHPPPPDKRRVRQDTGASCATRWARTTAPSPRCWATRATARRWRGRGRFCG